MNITNDAVDVFSLIRHTFKVSNAFSSHCNVVIFRCSGKCKGKSSIMAELGSSRERTSLKLHAFSGN